MALKPNCAVDKAAKKARKQQTSSTQGQCSVYHHPMAGERIPLITDILPFQPKQITFTFQLLSVRAERQDFYSIVLPGTVTRQYFCVTPGKSPGQFHPFSVPRQKYCGTVRKYAIPPHLDGDPAQLYSISAHLDCNTGQLYPGQAETFTVTSRKYNVMVWTYSVTCHLGCVPVQTYYVTQIFNLESIY